MAERNIQPLSKKAPKHASEQGDQQSNPQLEKEYHVLSIRYKRLQEQNTQLREEIEQFTQNLNDQENTIHDLNARISDWLSLVQQIRSEETRLPSFHARSSVKDRISQQHIFSADTSDEENNDQEELIPKQGISALNVWLVTNDRFVDQIVGHYVRERDRVFVIRSYEFFKQVVNIGMLPDIIITGAYDFGIDDPNHTAFFEFLDQVFANDRETPWPHEFFIVTLSSSVPDQPSATTTLHNHLVRHEFVSKLRGLQIIISEIRYFLEMRRCRPDVMESEKTLTVSSMEDVIKTAVNIQQQQRTGLLVVLSEGVPTSVRWALLLFFLNGKLVKTEYTLESSVTLPSEIEEETVKEIFTLSSLDSEYKLSEPAHVYFFPLMTHAVLREMQQKPFSVLSEEE